MHFARHVFMCGLPSADGMAGQRSVSSMTYTAFICAACSINCAGVVCAAGACAREGPGNCGTRKSASVNCNRCLCLWYNQ